MFRRNSWFRGALLGVLLFGGLVLFAVPLVAQAGGGPTDGENDEDEPVYDCHGRPCVDYVEVIGQMPGVVTEQTDTIFRVYFTNGDFGDYACGGPVGSVSRCHRGVNPYFYGRMVHPPAWLVEKNRRMRERQQQMRDSACAVIEPLSIAGGLSALGTAGLAQFMDDFVGWATRWGFRVAGLTAVLAIEILNGWCYLTSGDIDPGGRSADWERELLVR